MENKNSKSALQKETILKSSNDTLLKNSEDESILANRDNNVVGRLNYKTDLDGKKIVTTDDYIYERIIHNDSSTANIIDGGSGIDTVDYSENEEKITVIMEHNYVFGKIPGSIHDRIYNVENVIGTNFDDLIFGDGQNNLINGGEGNDDLRGGDGNDSLIGGIGNDFLNGQDGHDNLDGGEGNDLINGGAGNDYIVSSEGNDIYIGGTGTDVLNFSETNGINVNFTNTNFAFSQIFFQADGELTQETFLASANTAIGDGVDYVQDDFEVVLGSNYNDTIIANGLVEVINSFDGDDKILVDVNRDFNSDAIEINSSNGNDSIKIMVGDTPSNAFLFEDTPDIDFNINTGDGDDKIMTGVSHFNYNIDMGIGNDSLNTLGNNWSGGVGKTINADMGEGDDFLALNVLIANDDFNIDMGEGDDIVLVRTINQAHELGNLDLYLGEGNDTVIMEHESLFGSGSVRIMDFNSGEDIFDFSEISNGSSTAGIANPTQNFDDLIISYNESQNMTTIEFSSYSHINLSDVIVTDFIYLENFDNSQNILNADDFIF